jgi:hypothetical protein
VRASRRRDLSTHHLAWRVRLFGIGAVLALAGVYLDRSWLVNVALGVLVVGFALRFVPEKGRAEDDAETD